MGNMIKWQTGTPNIREGNSWYSTAYEILNVDVLAWYSINNIEPYKE